MKEFFGLTYDSQHGKAGLDDHAFIPGAFGTPLEVAGRAVGITKAQVSQDNAVISVILGQWIEVLIRVLHRQQVPSHDLSSVIEQPPQPHANCPTPFVEAFAAYLALAATFADR